MMYKIFVSANQKELGKERLAVGEVIRRNQTLRGYFDVFLFEEVSTKGKSPPSVYLKEVDKSDIYLGLIGNEYGVKGKDGLSGTEREYRRFIKKGAQGEPLIFIKGKDDSKKDKETQKFISTIKNSYIYDRFTSIDNLKTKVLNSLISFLDGKGILSKLPFDETPLRGARYNTIN